MSLTAMIRMKEVADKLKDLRPQVERKLKFPIRVHPRSNRYTLVGTAFDYLLRFELQRRAPQAILEPWVAESAPDKIWHKVGSDYRGMANRIAPTETIMTGPEDSDRARSIIGNAKKDLASYVRRKRFSKTQATLLATHAIRLAKLDPVIRASLFDPEFAIASPEDAEDLVAMLEIVPFDELLDKHIMLLNPSFKQSSKLVGGADADLIAGDLLVDIKTTIEPGMRTRDLDQLLGYFFLARKEMALDPNFPEIKRLGIYFARQGYLWTLSTSDWISHPAFKELEAWFFSHAEKPFSKLEYLRVNRKAASG